MAHAVLQNSHQQQIIYFAATKNNSLSDPNTWHQDGEGLGPGGRGRGGGGGGGEGGGSDVKLNFKWNILF